MSDGDYKPFTGLDAFIRLHYTASLASKVAERLRPLIEGMMDAEEVHRQVLVMHFARANPELGYPYFSTIFEEIFGSQPGCEWEHPYDLIASGKNRISARTGQLSRTVQVSASHLLVDDDTEYWGNWKFGRILVACSGVKPWFDMAFSAMAYSLILAKLEQILHDVYGMTAEAAGLVTYDGTTLPIFGVHRGEVSGSDTESNRPKRRRHDLEVADPRLGQF